MVEVTCGDCGKKYDTNTSNRDVHVCEKVQQCPKCGAAWDDYVFKYLNEDGDHEWLCTNIVGADLTRCAYREPIDKEETKSR